MNSKAKKIIEALQLEPLSIEGGYFRRTYTAADTLLNLPKRYSNPKARSFCSAIYFLLSPETYSRIHRLPTDEIYHFYLGDPVELLLLEEDGEVHSHKLGQDILNNFHPQFVVPKNTWQGSRLLAGGEFALLGTTMAPAFEYSDFERPESLDFLLEKYRKEYHKQIKDLY